MVLEKLVKLYFDKITGKITIAHTKQEAIKPIQLSGIIILFYSGYSDAESRLKILEKNVPKDANAYLGNRIIFNTGIAVGSNAYHPVVYYKIDDVQAKNSIRHVRDETNEIQDGFDGDVD